MLLQESLQQIYLSQLEAEDNGCLAQPLEVKHHRFLRQVDQAVGNCNL